MVDEKKFRVPFLLVLFLSAVPLAMGCSSSDTSNTGTVAGSVNYNGSSLGEGASVVFMDMTTGFTCAGVTDAEGKFQLESINDGNLPIGSYGVMVRPGGTMDMAAMEQASSAEDAMNDAGIAKPAAVKFPSKYNDLATSGLSFEVQQGANEMQIELVD
ncbi:hypothetical protein CA51_20050 [Rosistilla oblonga]|uniref:carboxypeptidase-like regulatory domain-containing protein n=1 Tax=Rosistilla oblonga TaxID=2527990 RepID=UPI0011886F97|nr:carboxypeptidase-like regulatory domain-containing protein [Rosistilla oblonga]QDV12129.1 hypothetical protein CA51_20050 [Rosistilla oblonga]